MTPDKTHNKAETVREHQPPSQLDQRLANLMDLADTLILMVMEMHQQPVIEQAEPILWGAAHHLIGSSDLQLRRFGYTLALSAISRRPETLQQAVTHLRTQLSDDIPLTWWDDEERTAGGHSHEH